MDQGGRCRPRHAYLGWKRSWFTFVEFDLEPIGESRNGRQGVRCRTHLCIYFCQSIGRCRTPVGRLSVDYLVADRRRRYCQLFIPTIRHRARLRRKQRTVGNSKPCTRDHALLTARSQTEFWHGVYIGAFCCACKTCGFSSRVRYRSL